MAIYIALLRGINLGPHKRIKMDRLRQSFKALGFDQVKTYIQSGNVVFKSGRASAAGLGKRIERQLLSDFGFSVSVILRTEEEIGKLIRNNPLLKDRDIDSSKLHVAFLADAPAPAAVKQLEALTVPPDRACCLGKELCLYFPNGVSGSSLWKHPLDRVLSVTTTTRNWNTVNQVYRMALDFA